MGGVGIGAWRGIKGGRGKEWNGVSEKGLDDVRLFYSRPLSLPPSSSTYSLLE